VDYANGLFIECTPNTKQLLVKLLKEIATSAELVERNESYATNEEVLEAPIEEDLELFIEYLKKKKLSEDYVKDVLSAFKRIQFPLRRSELLKLKTKYEVIALRHYIHFLEEVKGIEKYNGWLKLLKTPKSKSQKRLVKEQEIAELWKRIDREDMKAVFLALLFGARIKHVLKALEKAVQAEYEFFVEDIVKVKLESSRTKRVYEVFLPYISIVLAKKYGVPSYDSVLSYFRRRKLCAKFLRKFVSQVLEEKLMVEHIVVKYILGHLTFDVTYENYTYIQRKTKQTLGVYWNYIVRLLNLKPNEKSERQGKESVVMVAGPQH